MTLDKQTSRKRPYVLLPPVANGTDPSALHGPGDDPTFSMSLAFCSAPAAAAVEPSIGGGALRDQARGVPVVETLAAEAPVAATAPERSHAGTASFLDGLVFAVLLSVIGSSAGYYLAGQWTADSLTWSVVGGAAGLLLGGGLLLWTRRTH
jgi:hypothetical protein